MTLKYALVLGILVIIVYAGIQIALVRQRITIGKSLAATSQPFSFESSSTTKRFLIIGDSTGVGTGVTDPVTSLAGRLHGDYPEVTIVNRSVNGARIADVQKQLTVTEGSFDVIIIQGGANNILHPEPYKKSTEDMQALLKTAKQRSPHVLLLTCGNMGLAPFFPWPANWYYEIRSKHFLDSYNTIAKENGVVFVDLYTSRNNDVLAKDPKRFYAADGLHLSGEGYGWWYTRLRETLITNAITW